MLILRGTIVNRTYGAHKKLYIYLFLLTIFGPIYYVWYPVIRVLLSLFEATGGKGVRKVGGTVHGITR